MSLIRLAPCFLAIPMLLTACGPNERELTGQVFIVTQGGDNKKLGLVEVLAFPENNSEVLTYFKTSHAALVARRPPAEAAYNASKTAYEEARDRDSQEEKTIKHLLDFARDPYKDLSARRAALSSASAHTKRFEKTTQEVALLRKQLTDAIDTQIFWLSSELYFQKLPTHLATAKTKTDADGKFSMKLPAGRYVVAAAATRKVSDKEEKYFWLIRVDTSARNESVMLSNDNRHETGCSACLNPQQL